MNVSAIFPHFSAAFLECAIRTCIMNAPFCPFHDIGSVLVTPDPPIFVNAHGFPELLAGSSTA